ncbi:MAG: hypothetical protein QW775_07130 [Ignisphaera sp.]
MNISELNSSTSDLSIDGYSIVCIKLIASLVVGGYGFVEQKLPGYSIDG